MKKVQEFVELCKKNKKLLYALGVLLVLMVIAFVINIDFSSGKQEASTDELEDSLNLTAYDEYVENLEGKLEGILLEIEGISSVKAMIYTRNSPKLEPIYNESNDKESNVETDEAGVTREIKRDTTEKKVETKDGEVIVEKYYEYPKVSGVLIVVSYSGKENIYKILTNSVKALLNIDVNNIEVIVCNNRG